MPIVVTGATGRLGRLVVERLLERGVPAGEVRAVGRDPERLAVLAAHGVDTARVDYDVPLSLDPAFDGADAVLFVSTSAFGEARMAQHRNVVEAAKRAGVPWLLYTSIVHADTVDTVLTPGHRATEELIRASGLRHTFLRNTLYTEEQVPSILQAAARNEILAGWGEGAIASATIADLAEGAAVVLLQGTRDEVLELTGDTAWNGYDLAAAATELLGRPIVYSPRTTDEMEIELGVEHVAPEEAAFRVAFDGDIRNGAFGHATRTLSSLLGRPTTPLVEGLRAALPRDLPQAPSTLR
jgi:NAD(P)H dehydrogenase (quinone)